MPTIGVFIDAQKVPAELAGPALDELDRFGELMIKRAYADWSVPGTANWSRQLMRHAIAPMQSIESSTGRHALDTAMVAQAIDLHRAGILDGFAILCGDDSFVFLASRLRSEGATVIGGGGPGVSRAFIDACDSYLDLDSLGVAASAARATLAAHSMSRRTA